MHPGTLLVSTTLLLTTLGSPAAEPAPAGFTAGFEQLSALGLPALPQGTRWVALPEAAAPQIPIGDNHRDGLKGNAWMLPASGENPPRVLAPGSLIPQDFEPDAAQTTESPSMLGRLLGKKPAKKKRPAIPDADLETDTRRLAKQVAKNSKFDDIDDFRRDWNGNGAQSFGPLLVFATQLHQAGHTALADELALALFNEAPNREVVIDAALNHLGNQRYKLAADAFFASRDWKEYHQQLGKLVRDLPRGWDAHPAVALMLEPIASRAAGNPPADPKLDNTTISPEALNAVAWLSEDPPADSKETEIPPEIARQLKGVPAQYRAQYLAQLMGRSGGAFQSLGIWLLTAPEETEKIKNPAKPIVALGIDSLPALAALTDDPYLTARNHPEQGSNSWGYQESRIERAMRAIQAMRRPASRGDFASLLLTLTLPDPDGENSSLDPISLRELALDFWRANQGKSREELALVFLSEGSNEQAATAANILATSSDPAHHQVLESQILSSPSLLIRLPAVQIYLKARNSKAAGFHAAYVKALREEIGDGSALEDDYDIPYQLRDIKRVNTTLKQLDALVAGKSPQAQAREIARESSSEDAALAIRALQQSISEEPPQRRLLAMLAGAKAATDPEIRATFLTATFQAGQSSEESDDPSIARRFSESEAKVWKELIADETETPANSRSYFNEPGLTLGKLAAFAFEASVNPDNVQDIIRATSITGETIGEIAVARATARLDSQPVPPLPDASKVTPERLREIVAAAGSKAPKEIHPYLKTLSHDERAAWSGWFKEPGDLPIPESVAQLGTFLVGNLEGNRFYKHTPGIQGLEVGWQLNAENLSAHLAKLAENLDEHSRSMLLLSSAPFPPGLDFLTTAIKLEPSDEKPTKDDEFAALIERPGPEDIFRELIRALESDDAPEALAGALHLKSASRSRQKGFNIVWWVMNDGTTVVRKSEDDADPFAGLTKSLEASPPLYLHLQVLSRADAEKIIKLNQDN